MQEIKLLDFNIEKAENLKTVFFNKTFLAFFVRLNHFTLIAMDSSGQGRFSILSIFTYLINRFGKVKSKQLGRLYFVAVLDRLGWHWSTREIKIKIGTTDLFPPVWTYDWRWWIIDIRWGVHQKRNASWETQYWLYMYIGKRF